MFTLYSADIIGNPGNCSYPNKNTITDAASLQLAVCHDYVCAEYKNNYRNGDNFLGADCLPVDCDNDHSENPADWVLPADVAAAFPDVSFAVHYSRYNMREKNGKPARPKFHILFPIEYMTDAAVYSDMKKLVNSIFPYFDTQALDAARFFFGTASADVELFPGSMNLTEFLENDDFDADLPGGHHASLVIPEGSRNADHVPLCRAGHQEIRRQRRSLPVLSGRSREMHAAAGGLRTFDHLAQRPALLRKVSSRRLCAAGGLQRRHLL
jgi:putative DNA primase/helicase